MPVPDLAEWVNLYSLINLGITKSVKTKFFIHQIVDALFRWRHIPLFHGHSCYPVMCVRGPNTPYDVHLWGAKRKNKEKAWDRKEEAQVPNIYYYTCKTLKAAHSWCVISPPGRMIRRAAGASLVCRNEKVAGSAFGHADLVISGHTNFESTVYFLRAIPDSKWLPRKIILWKEPYENQLRQMQLIWCSLDDGTCGDRSMWHDQNIFLAAHRTE